MQTKVKDVLRKKEEWILTVNRDHSAYEALQKMFEHEVGSIIIKDQGEPKGIFTERDYIRRVVLDDHHTKEINVEEVMTPSMICVDPEYLIEECMAIMTHQRCRHLPVMKNGELSNMISIGDCTKELSQRAELKIKHLENYISGEYPV